MHDPLTGIRCYEVFRAGRIAFERDGKLCFGPQSKLSAFLTGSDESFFVGEAAQTAIAEERKQQGDSRFRSTTSGSDNDGLAQTRRRWENERASGQWTPEYVRQQLKELP
jgi:hypothetical protein